MVDPCFASFKTDLTHQGKVDDIVISNVRTCMNDNGTDVSIDDIRLYQRLISIRDSSAGIPFTDRARERLELNFEDVRLEIERVGNIRDTYFQKSLLLLGAAVLADIAGNVFNIDWDTGLKKSVLLAAIIIASAGFAIYHAVQYFRYSDYPA